MGFCTAPTNRILLSLLILGCVIYITACNSLGFLQSTPSPAEREAEEYAVYRAILGEGESCILSQTIEFKEISPDEFPELGPKMIEDFNTYRVQTLPLNPNLDLGGPVTILSDTELDEIFVDYSHQEWDQFYAQTECTEIVSISRVGFNAQMNEALVFYTNVKYAGVGWGRVMLLKKGKDGKWYESEYVIEIEY